MRLRSLQTVTEQWIRDAKWLYCVEHLPAKVRLDATFSAIRHMRNGDPVKARARVYKIVGKWVDETNRPSWDALVKSPLSADAGPR